MIFYFSGTGNSHWVAKRLASQLGDALIPMADAEAMKEVYACKKGERVGFVFPVYAWAPPKVVLDFLARVRPIVVLSPDVPVCLHAE